jgi:hypothetical protein
MSAAADVLRIRAIETTLATLVAQVAELSERIEALEPAPFTDKAPPGIDTSRPGWRTRAAKHASSG